jgi:uncharacterized protein (TIGR02246 family)
MTDKANATQDIAQLYARYADAVWRHDYEAFGRCFTPDGEWRISGLELRGRDRITATIERILERFRKVRIVVGTPILDFESSGTASGRVQMTEHCAWKNGDTNISLGTYYDRYVLTEGRWCFAWRLFAMDYRGPPDLTGTWFETPDFGPPPAMPPLDTTTPDIATERWATERWGVAQR